MRSYPSLPVKAFFDGFEWKSGGWLFKQVDKSGNFVIEFNKTAEKSNFLAISSFINTHAHISHLPRYSNQCGSDVLEGKPNIGGYLLLIMFSILQVIVLSMVLTLFALALGLKM